MLNESAGEGAAFTLLISEKGGVERRQSFRVAEATVGRVAGNDIVLPKGNVSKRHARILFREGRLIVTDLNSTNGTFVNRRRITQATILREEDRLFIGDYVLRVEGLGQTIDSAPTDTTDRLSAPPLAGNKTAPALESEALGPAALGSDRLLPTEEGARAMPSLSSTGRGAEAAEQSRPSQRSSENASLQTGAVLRVIENVISGLGEPPTEPTEEVRSAFLEAIAGAVDHLLVEGDVPVGVSAESILDQAKAELLDLGPIRAFLDDANVTVLAGTRHDDLVEIRDGKAQNLPRFFSSTASLRRALARLIAFESGEARALPPHFEEVFASGLSVSVASLPEAAEAGPIFSLRKPSRESVTLDELVKRGTLSRAMATFLQLCAASRVNLLLLSPPEEGANLLLEALLGALSRERILLAGHLTLARDVHPSLCAVGRREAEGLGPSFSVGLSIPGCRVALALPSAARLVEFFELSPAATGSLISVVAPSARAAVRSIPVSMVAARAGLPLDAATRWFEGAFDVVVELGRHRDGRVRVLRVAEWGEHGELVDIFLFQAVRGSSSGGIEGNFVASGEVPRTAERLQAAGVRLDATLFQKSTGQAR